MNETGQVVVEQAQIVDPEQARFWTQKWQRAEQESRADYEARIDINYRMTYVRFADDTLEMSYVDKHDDALKHP